MDFDDNFLKLECKGVTNITGKDSQFNRCNLELKGIANINFKKVILKKANLDVKGNGKVVLNFANGIISGSVKGLYKIKYYGNIIENRLDLEGLSKFSKN